jgi:hypothetical protein
MSLYAIATYLVTAVILPFLAPILMDCFAGIWIMAVNKAKGKPTWVVGTRFEDVILPNAASIGCCYVYKVTWNCILLKRIEQPGMVRMKKSKMLKCTPVETQIL